MANTKKDALRELNMDLRAKLDAIEQAEGLPDLLAKYMQACVRNAALSAERDYDRRRADNLATVIDRKNVECDDLRQALAESDEGLNYMHLYDDDTPKEASQ